MHVTFLRKQFHEYRTVYVEYIVSYDIIHNNLLLGLLVCSFEFKTYTQFISQLHELFHSFLKLFKYLN